MSAQLDPVHVMRRRSAIALLLAAVGFAPVFAAAGAHRHRGQTDLYEDELHFPDADDPGTGTFTVTLIPGALMKVHGINAMEHNAPAFQISATVSRDGHGVVVLGHADGPRPRDWASFEFPTDIDLAAPHTLLITFTKWRISGVSMDGLPVRWTRGGKALLTI